MRQKNKRNLSRNGGNMLKRVVDECCDQEYDQIVSMHALITYSQTHCFVHISLVTALIPHKILCVLVKNQPHIGLMEHFQSVHEKIRPRKK
jgi:hypothetical protein